MEMKYWRETFSFFRIGQGEDIPYNWGNRADRCDFRQMSVEA